MESGYDGGIAAFAQECVDAVFGWLPLADNYFWRVYLLGRYAPDCCPEHLKPANFVRFKDGLADCISVHTNSVQHFLEPHDAPSSRFVLLDHMDWLSDRYFPALVAEWQAIVDRAAPAARAIWRSGGLQTDYIDRVAVRTPDGGTWVDLGGGTGAALDAVGPALWAVKWRHYRRFQRGV